MFDGTVRRCLVLVKCMSVITIDCLTVMLPPILLAAVCRSAIRFVIILMSGDLTVLLLLRDCDIFSVTLGSRLVLRKSLLTTSFPLYCSLRSATCIPKSMMFFFRLAMLVGTCASSPPWPIEEGGSYLLQTATAAIKASENAS
eukprot:s198_g14.t1